MSVDIQQGPITARKTYSDAAANTRLQSEGEMHQVFP